MQLGDESNGNLRDALNTILEEFSSYDAEKQEWMREKSMLLKQLTELERELDSKNEQLAMLAKRYKVLEMSLQSMNGNGKNNKMNEHWAHTLPLNFDNNSKVMDFINQLNSGNDLSKGQFSNDQDISTRGMNNNKNNRNNNNSTNNNNNNNNNMSNNNNNNKNSNNGNNYFDEKENENMSNDSKKAEIKSGNMNLLTSLTSENSKNNNLASIDSWMNLRHHLDSVRCLCYDDSQSNNSLLVCGSDDGVISLWNLEKIVSKGTTSLNKNNSNNVQDIYQPWMSYHGHKTSVICNCIINGSPTQTFEENVSIFATGGMDGELMIWKAPSSQDNNRSDFSELAQWRIGCIKETKDILWDIKCHAKSPIVAAVSADRYFRLFDISNTDDLTNTEIFKCDVSEYPSCVSWNSAQSVVIGCNNGSLQHWDTDKGREISTMIDDSKTGHSGQYCINKVAISRQWKDHLIFAACSDNRLRCFDLRDKKQCVIRQNVHTASVNDIRVLDSEMGYSIVTVSDDCRVRAWNMIDLRILKDLDTINTHRSKNDEGITCMEYDATTRVMISGGADGNIKLYRVS